MDVQEQIRQQVEKSDALLFMKGTPDFPQCGFSSQVVQLMNACGAPYDYVNVLDNEDVREGVKAFSNWPTIPQLYIKGEFVGGCDIVTDLHQRGELQGMLTPAT